MNRNCSSSSLDVTKSQVLSPQNSMMWLTSSTVLH